MKNRYRVAPRIRIEVVRDEAAPFYGSPLRGPADVFRMLSEEARGWDREHFLSLLVDGRHKVIGLDDVSVGTLTASLVHPREVFKSAIVANAAALVLVHNHPSGDPAPSTEDREITKRLADAAELIGITLLDHVILGHDRFHSFAESEVDWRGRTWRAGIGSSLTT
jgi:DNA repair protein RadC